MSKMDGVWPHIERPVKYPAEIVPENRAVRLAAIIAIRPESLPDVPFDEIEHIVRAVIVSDGRACLTRPTLNVNAVVVTDDVSNAPTTPVAEHDWREPGADADVVLNQVVTAVFVEIYALVIRASAPCVVHVTLPHFAVGIGYKPKLPPRCSYYLHTLYPTPVSLN